MLYISVRSESETEKVEHRQQICFEKGWQTCISKTAEKSQNISLTDDRCSGTRGGTKSPFDTWTWMQISLKSFSPAPQFHANKFIMHSTDGYSG